MGSKKSFTRINEEINEEWISDKTRYACDGLKIKDYKPLKKIMKLRGNKENVYKNPRKISKSSPDKIVGLTGDMTNMETMFIVKDCLKKR